MDAYGMHCNKISLDDNNQKLTSVRTVTEVHVCG